MSHVRKLSPQSNDRIGSASPIIQSSSVSEPLFLRDHDPHWEDRWQAAFRRLKIATKAYDAALQEDTEHSLVVQLKSVVMRREIEVHRAFLSQFRTTDEYAAWKLDILDLELRWHPKDPHKMATGLPMVEITRRLNAVQAYALGPILSSPNEPPSNWRCLVRAILECPPSIEVIHLAARLRRQGGDKVLRSTFN